MTAPRHDPIAAIDRLAVSLDSARLGLEQIAYQWARQADLADPDTEDDDLASGAVAYDTEEAEQHGYSNGLRDAAKELLQAIDRGRRCAKCHDPIIDPCSAPVGDSALCRNCGDQT